MARMRYKTSKISKNNILETCKELFYLHGYKETTYVDICEKADSNPGLINYYFKTKRNIAAQIYEEYLQGIKDHVKEHIIKNCGQYDLQVGTALEIRIFTDLLYQDENIAQFYNDICLQDLECNSDVDYNFYKLHAEEYNLPFTDDEIKLIHTYVSGGSIGILKQMLEGYFTSDAYTIYKFRVKTMYNIMGIPNERIAEILGTTEELFNNMKFAVNDYFNFEILSQ